LGKISRKELIKQYQECGFFASASKWEGFGLIFLEAAACAKPSIGYRKGSIPEVVLDGKMGFLVNSYEELKQKAGELIKDKKLRKKMGKEALKFSKNFSWDKSAKEYENIFNKLISKIGIN
jgi:glycosyltransferase involved in cell wall biosynthesis